MRNALKQTVLLWTLLLLLTTWLGFFAVSAVVKYAVVVILVAVTAAVMAYWHKKKGQVVADDVWPSSLPPETYRQPVVLVCGDMSAHLFTDSPVRQVSEGLYLPVSDEEQLVAQVERLLTLRPAWASQFAVAYTVMPGMYRDAAVLTGQLRRFAHSMATVRRRAGVNVPWLLWSGLSGSPLPERANSPWFICTGGEVQVATSAETTMPAQWIAQSGAQERSQRLCYLLKAESLMQWLDLNVLAELNGPEAKCPPLAMTVGLVPSLPAVDNNQNRPDAGYRGHRHRRCAAIPGCPVTAVAASVGLYPAATGLRDHAGRHHRGGYRRAVPVSHGKSPVITAGR